MAKLELEKRKVVFEGLADLMFDRFIDHSKDKRAAEQRLYLTEDSELFLPAENIFAFIVGENPPGCARSFEGKQGRKFTAAANAYLAIQPAQILIKQAGKPVKVGAFPDKRFHICEMAARTKQGTLSIKQEAKPRPVLELPWAIEFQLSLIRNDEGLDMAKIENWFNRGGLLIGLGTFRPRYGRFMVKEFASI